MELIILSCSFLLGTFLASQKVSVTAASLSGMVPFILFFFWCKEERKRLAVLFCYLVFIAGLFRGQPGITVSSNSETEAVTWFINIRNVLADSLASVLPEPQSSLAQALLLGVRGNIPANLLNSFTGTGTTHIMAISGLNISIVAGVFLSLGVWLFGRRRPLYLILPLLAVWGYTMVSGALPSALRAAIMASLFLIAEGAGRQRNAASILLLTAAIMVAIKPPILGELSFQLSFLAMSGLVFLAPWFHDSGISLAGKIPGLRSVSFMVPLVDSIAVSLGAIIVTFPLVAYRFGTFSLVSLPATILLLPVVTPLIIMSFIVALLGIIIPPLAYIVGWVVWLFASYMILVVNWFASLPSITLDIPINLAIIWIYYVLLFIYISRKMIKTGIMKINPYFHDKFHDIRDRLVLFSSCKTFQKWSLLIFTPVVILLWVAALTWPDDNLHVSFLDVGQGDAILIQKGRQQVLIDGGPDTAKISLELGKRMPFWDRRIEMIILTHAQNDHINGLLEVLQHYQVDNTIDSGVFYDTKEYIEWLQLIEQNNINHAAVRNGQLISINSDMKLKILNPHQLSTGGNESDINNNSVVMTLIYGRASFLFTGDIEEAVEYQLLHGNNEDLHSTVLKVAHHGSDSSTSPPFLNAVSPQIAIISAGENNRFGLPNLSVVNRLKEQLNDSSIYLTSRDGTVTISTDGIRMWAETEKTSD